MFNESAENVEFLVSQPASHGDRILVQLRGGETPYQPNRNFHRMPVRTPALVLSALPAIIGCAVALMLFFSEIRQRKNPIP
jgi:hypothetical protein